ncbi:hypothetical protein EZS27_042016 [termite gut metagenome]|uniref:Antirepressor protein ant N-terminal domain-containing protein n=1 Tax=termite gut metagenome TaxID=433724 RepID=A0A5J4PD12_9ZZZZ
MTLNPEELIPIRPICRALGIDYSYQVRKIKKDEDLSSVMVLSATTGFDGKEHKTLCSHFEVVAGWLFTINPMNVKPERVLVFAYLKQYYRDLCEKSGWISADD